MKNTDYPSIIRTDRLVLCKWNNTDLEPFAALNADPRVMEYFPSTLNRKESDDLAKRICTQLEEQGWGLWAVSIPDIANFIGFIGLARPSFDAHFTPAVEVGWRLTFDYWGRGYATEGAKAALAFGFDTLNLEEIVSFTAVQNERSKRIMEKIGMHNASKDDFDHPKLPEGHPLRRHVLYRINQQEWRHQTHKKQKYVYKPYSKIFPDLFQKEKERIVPFLITALAIEHVGSTAIPGLGGKGIIDIAISVSKEELGPASSSLQKLGYEFRPTFSTPDRFYFITYLADPEEGSRRYHIHLTYPSTKEWEELIGFRDYLRTHPDTVEEYANIKKQAADGANQDEDQYRKMKEPIFQKINALIKGSHSPIQIIYLNGPSSSGKTTLAKAMQHAFEEPFLHVGIDKIIGWMPEKINDWTGGEAPLGYSWKKSVDTSGNPIQELQVGSYAQKIGKTFQEIIVALAKMGHRIVIDDVSFGKQQLDEWKKTLKDFRVLWIGVDAPLPILEQREKERGNRIPGSARGQFHKIHADTTYDLKIDTHQATVSENIEKIMSLALSPSNIIELVAKKMNVNLCKATKEDKNTIQNLGRFYVYEMSRYCGFLPTWETPSNGLFECIDLSSYLEKVDRYAFLIKVDDELAGFILINKVGSTPDVDWNIGEFFIVSKFQGKGIGRIVAEQVFNQFPGVWETSQIPENTAAIEFWNKVVSRYSHGQFEKTLKTIPEPKPHPMIILKFISQGRT